MTRKSFGGGGHALGQRHARVVGGEVDAVAAVDLPVDVARDDVRAAVTVGDGVVIAGDDNRERAESEGGEEGEGKSGSERARGAAGEGWWRACRDQASRMQQFCR